MKRAVLCAIPGVGSVVLWTRVTVPQAAQNEPLRVDWELSETPDFSAILQSGGTVTDAARVHCLPVGSTVSA